MTVTASGAELITFASREEADIAGAEIAANAIRDAISARDEARFLTSGGTTPSGLLNRLSFAELDWARVKVGLVDDRFVPPDHDASNEALVRRSLLKHKAQVAEFASMWAEDTSIDDVAHQAAEVYAQLVPADFVLLGMGNDGHTASWFPGAANLSRALDQDAEKVVAIDATGCPVAGEFTQRLTLSRPAIASARQAVLLIYGDEKRAVLDAALKESGDSAPVSLAIRDLADRLKIVWAP